MLLNVQRMTCGHCVRAVRSAIATVAPQAQVEVDLTSGAVRVDGATDVEAIAAAIREQGYTVEILDR